MRIELYIDSESESVGGPSSGKVNLNYGYAELRRKAKNARSTITIDGIDSNERQAKNILKELSEKMDFEYATHDMATREGKKLARKNKISVSPTVIIDNTRLEGYFSRNDVLRALGVNVERINPESCACPHCGSAEVEVYEDGSGECKECRRVFMKAALIRDL